MTETLSFPGLGISFEISRVAFTIPGLNIDIYWYGVFYAIAFIVGGTYFHKRCKQFGFHSYDGLDVLLGAIFGGLIGARLYFVAFRWELYQDNLIKILSFREGGMALYGGVFGAILVAVLYCRFKKQPVTPLLDVGFTAMILAQAVGRWGNFFNMEAFGTNTTAPWGMTSKTIVNYLMMNESRLVEMGVMIDPAAPVHPTFLYESIWNLAGFLVLAFILTPRRRYDGEVFLGYMAWYGLGRFFIEGLRTDSLTTGSDIRVSQALAIILFVAATLLLITFRVMSKSENRPAFLKMYVETDKSQARIAEVDRQLEEEKNAAKKKREARQGKAEEPAENPGDKPQDKPAEEPADAEAAGETPAEPAESEETEETEKLVLTQEPEEDEDDE